jgi:tetratricopeptide (TPR) repeat protein
MLTLNTTGGNRGSAGYRAPEVLSGLPPTKKANIWSLGCIFYELCTGKQAFADDVIAHSYRSPADLPDQLLDGLGEEMKQVVWAEWVSRMLQVDSRRRPSVAFLSVQFGSLIVTMLPETTDTEVYSWCSERYILGSDGPITGGIIRWTDIFVPGGFEQRQIAYRRYARILDTRSNLLGSEHPATLWSASHLIWVYLHQRANLEAERLLKEVDKQTELLKRHAFPQSWAIPYAFAWSYTGQKRHQEAAECYKKVLQIQTSSLGSQHPDTLACLDDLTWSLYDLGQRRNTLAQLENILQKLTLLLGPDHSYTLYSINGIGDYYYAQGQYDVALRWYEKAFESVKRVAGMGHPYTLRSMISLAQSHCLLKHRDYNGYDKTLEVARRLLGPRDDRILTLSQLIDDLRNNEE